MGTSQGVGGGNVVVGVTSLASLGMAARSVAVLASRCCDTA